MSTQAQNTTATAGLSPEIFTVLCVCAAIAGTLLWTGLTCVIYRKRKQRLLQLHLRKDSLLDTTGAPRGETAAQTGREEQSEHANSGFGKEEAHMHVRTTSSVIREPAAGVVQPRKSSYCVPAPIATIPDEPIELMDRHYSQQFGKFKTVEWRE